MIDMSKIIYEYVHGNNGPASELRSLGTEEEFEKEKEIRNEKGYGFFELYYSDVDLGEHTTRRELDEANDQ